MKIDIAELKKAISCQSFYSRHFPEHKTLANGEWMVCCPFHDDKNPSMSINIDSGLYHCHGCDAQGDVIEFHKNRFNKSFNETVDDLAKQYGVKPAKPQIVQTYEYVDANRNLVSQTVRFEPKDFRQRTKKNGQWVWSLKGISPVLYNLPDVMASERILVMEGEKDCDRAIELGYAATTCPMGAKSWKVEYDKELYGKEVILIADNDPVGVKHMLAIGKRLKDKSNVKWIDFFSESKKGYDFSDFADKDNSTERISHLLRAARGFDESKIIIPEPDTKESDEIKKWIMASPGEFSSREIDYDLGFVQPKQKKERTKILEKFVGEKFLSREGSRRGHYRPYLVELKQIDFVNTSDRFLPIRIPLGISDMVGIMPGNIIILAGESNAGKTSLNLNIIKDNMHRFNVHYFNSEMGAGELHSRLNKFDDIDITQWKFNAYNRNADFADVVFKGENSLNIIDFLEVYDDFFAIGEKIKRIHEELDGAVAIISIQKNVGAIHAVGGNRTMEKARLVINISPGEFKITKAKNFIRQDLNPNGLSCRWKLVNGCKFMETGGWGRFGKETGNQS